KETVPQVEPPAEGQSSNAQAVQAVQAIFCITCTARPRLPKNYGSHWNANTKQRMLHDIHAEGMTLSETFQVAAIIEKLPPSWVEYVAPFAELCAKHGIRHEFTAPYSPQQNGIPERKNRTLKEMVTAMLISSGMSRDMWGEAILTATYLLNKIPHKDKEETLYELWMGRKPSYQYLRVWGCLAKVAMPAPKA
ncbi:retrotransposon protein, putative, ty1-copia subclass, partial [Tanacetum coccineum]